MTTPFCQYQVQGHRSRSRSNIKVIFLEKMAIEGALVRDKSPTLDHVTVLFKIRLIFHTLGSLVSRKITKRIPERELSSVVLFVTSDI